MSLQRHPSLYLDDGDIVLAAPSTSPAKRQTMLFRVDKVYLARNSPIFKDMFSFSPGQEAQDTYDGVPRVNLTDSAEDLESLLAAMYNIASLPLRKFDPEKPRLLMGTMRLALKYEVDGLRDVVIRNIAEDWPHDRRSYETWSAERARIMKDHPADWWRRFPEPAAAMQFATEFGCSEILTSIVYYMATVPATLTALLYSEVSASGPPQPRFPHAVRWNFLDSLNFFRLQLVQSTVKDNLPQFDYHVKMPISDPPCCEAGLERALKECRYLDVMRSQTYILETFKNEGVCSVCVAEIEANSDKINEWKDALWLELSERVTQLPVPWPEVTKEDEPMI
ncbi:hypothetical protein EIP86_002826 [Pleurotus ostreatoroseus]|nr:hypothetical protein EIP86_002826 [Pleurotus ostreatoroseus]